jgi:GNAT superfamily N-acetyltransferase
MIHQPAGEEERRMSDGPDPLVRAATPDDVEAICAFGDAHIRSHYAPLIGEEAADAQVRHWWNHAQISSAVAAGLVLVAEAEGQLLGVAQRGRREEDHVVYKLYVHPDHRGTGVGLRLLDAVIGQLPAGADRLLVEHFAANERAGAFYEREGFAVDSVAPSPTGDPALDIVWRSRPL